MQLTRFCLFYIFLLFTTNVKAQNSENLKKYWETYKDQKLHDTTRLDALTSIAEIYRNSKPDSAIVLCDDLINYANNKKQYKYVVYAYNIKGHSAMNKGNNDDALQFYLKALDINKKENNIITIGQSYNNIATIYQKKADFKNTLYYYLEALKVYEQKKGTEVYISNTYNNLGRFYSSQKNYDVSLDYIQKALIIKQKLNDKKELANTYNNLGIVYRLKKDYDNAIKAQTNALEIRKNILDKIGLANSYTNIGNLYQLQKNYDKSIAYFLKALTINKELSNKEGVEIVYASLTNIYSIMENDSTARKYADSTLLVNKTIDNKEISILALHQISKAQLKDSNYLQAYNNLMQSKLIEDSIFNLDNSKIMSEFKTQYEVDKKAIELNIIANEEKKYIAKINESKLSKQRNQKLAFGAIALLALGGVGFIFLQYKQKKKSNAQLNTINDKINKQNNTLKTLNTELIESEENLQKSNNSKEQLINMMSHDLLNPITAITNYNQQIINRPNNTEDLLNAFKTVDAAIQPMHNLLDNMLQWTAIQKDGITAKIKLQDVNEIVKEIISIYRPQANLKFIKLYEILQTDFVTETDKSILSLILRNLLNNAIKYSANETSILISTNASEKTITIQDEGFGMTDEMIGFLNNKQFDKIEAKGSGLGLKLCFEFAKAIGAKIIFAKNENKGIQVNIKLA